MTRVVDIGERRYGADDAVLSLETTLLRCNVRGWGNPRPIQVCLPADTLPALRAGVARDLEALRPRCEALDRDLAPDTRHKAAYIASRHHTGFAPEISAAAHGNPDWPCAPRLPASRLRTRHDPVPDMASPLAPVLARLRAMVAVGEVADPCISAALARVAAPRLSPGDGVLDRSPGGRPVPARDAFSSWLAHHDEPERETIGAFAFGRTAGRVDVDLLRLRLHGHQRVLVDAGSPSLTWLLAQWDGNVARDGDVFVFSEPGAAFRVPSARLAAAPGAIASAFYWPRISVVTVSFNQGEYLEQCLRSVLDQRYPNLEHIVIDAGSTDGSIDILNRYRDAFAKLVIEPDKGQSDGLNKGFRLATGDILTWVNSDDMLAPLSLFRAALAFAQHGVDMVAGTCSRVAGVQAGMLFRHHAALPTGVPMAFDLADPLDWSGSWEVGDYFYQPEVFFTRAIWERAGACLRPHLYWAMDWELWLRFALAGASIVRIPDVLGISREHDAQKTTSEKVYLWQISSILRDFDQLLERLGHEAVMA